MNAEDAIPYRLLESLAEAEWRCLIEDLRGDRRRPEALSASSDDRPALA